MNFKNLYLSLWAGLCGTLGVSAQDRPNVLFILADDLGYGDLGCYGQEKLVPAS